MTVHQKPVSRGHRVYARRPDPPRCPRCGQNLRLVPPARLAAGVVVCDVCLHELPESCDLIERNAAPARAFDSPRRAPRHPRRASTPPG